jgi:hypothetical protein
MNVWDTENPIQGNGNIVTCQKEVWNAFSACVTGDQIFLKIMCCYLHVLKEISPIPQRYWCQFQENVFATEWDLNAYSRRSAGCSQ